MEAAIHRDSPRCCSMRERRFMWQESPALWPKGSAGREKWLRRAPRVRRSIGCVRRALVFPDDADHDALNDDVVSILDVFVDHGVPAYLEHVAAPAPRQQLVGDGNRYVVRHCLDRMSGGDEPEQRQLGGAGLTFGRDDFDGPALVVRAPDVSLAFEVGEVLVYRRERLKPELARDLLEARGVPLLFEVFGDVIEDLALAPRDRHGCSRRFTET